MKSKLKYLYKAIYKDGSSYEQNIDDISIANPDKSCYNDLKLDEIAAFTLSDGTNTYTLDLSDGGIKFNGYPKFFLTTDTLTAIKLEHFRRVTLSIVDESRVMTVNYILGYEAINQDGNPIINHIVIK